MENISKNGSLNVESNENSDGVSYGSEVKGFIGDAMTSDSGSFYGFPETNQSTGNVITSEAPPSTLINESLLQTEINITKGANVNVNVDEFDPVKLSKLDSNSKVSQIVDTESNEISISEDFSVDFGTVENMPTLFGAIPKGYNISYGMGAPHSTPKAQYTYENKVQEQVVIKLPKEKNNLQINCEQQQIKDKNNINEINITENTQQTGLDTQTNSDLDEQTEKSELISMMYMLCKKVDESKDDIKETQDRLENNMHKHITEVVETQNKLTQQMTQQITEVLGAVDGLDSKLTCFKTDLDSCRNDITTLQTEVTTTSQQVALIHTKVEENVEVIREIKENVSKMETEIAEKLQGSSLNIENKYSVIKENVSNMFVNLQQSKQDLEELRIKYFHLEGAVVQNREQGNYLNNQLVELTKNVISDVTKSPEKLETLLQKVVSPPNINLNQMKTVTTNNYPNKQTALPSISSSPLLSSGFFTPSLTGNQTYPTSAQISTRPDSEELIMKTILKREKTPSFDGNSISAPQFLEEIETYFAMVNIHNDCNRMKAFGSFLQGVPNGWWKRISKNILTWEDAKTALLTQYFNDYNKERFEQEWKEWEYSKVCNAEAFALRAFNLLDIVKPEYTFKKKCQNIASKLPASLMNYLLQKDFKDEQDFMVILKEAMTLTNFKESPTPIKANNKAQPGSNTNNSASTSFNNAGNNNSVNNNNNNQSSTYNNPNQIITNPNYKGKPSNFIPNYRKPTSNYNNNGNYNNNNNNSGNNNNGNNQGRRWSNNGRQWSNGGNSNQKPYFRPRWNNGGQSQNPSNQQVPGSPVTGVNNIAMTQTPSPTSSPLLTPSSVAGPPMVMIPQDTADAMTALCRQFMNIVSPGVTPPASPDGQGQDGQQASNF